MRLSWTRKYLTQVLSMPQIVDVFFPQPTASLPAEQIMSRSRVAFWLKKDTKVKEHEEKIEM